MTELLRLPIEILHITWRCFFIFSLLLIPIQSTGQNQGKVKEKYRWFDTMIGQTNSGLFKGVTYNNTYRVINEKNQFFENKDFRTGSVSYYGQRYFDIPLKYDVYLDDLLVVNNELANKPIMVFDKEGVSDFTIEGDSFERISTNPDSNVASGFYQVLLNKDSLTIYKKLRKKIFKRTDEQIVYYEFKDGYSYLLYFGDVYYPFRKFTELNRFFSRDRKKIKAISKKHRALKKSNSDAYMKAVLSDLLQLKTTANQEEL